MEKREPIIKQEAIKKHTERAPAARAVKLIKGRDKDLANMGASEVNGYNWKAVRDGVGGHRPASNFCRSAG